MKNTVKKLSLLFATMLMIVLFAVSASAKTTSDGFVYSVSDGEVIIEGYEGSLTELEIPSEIDGYPVTTIGYRAFYFDNLSSIKIPSSIKTIDEEAFQQCGSLENFKVDINNDFYSTDEYGVLYNKDKTTLIQYPIGHKRSSYSIADSTKTIQKHSFVQARNLVDIDIPKSVTTIGSLAFLWCEKLSKVKISENVKLIDDRAFSDCVNLKMIEVNKDNNYYCSDEYGVLFNKDRTILLQYPIGNERSFYEIPAGVRDIAQNSFYGAIYLDEIIIPDTVKYIGDSAFQLVSITDLNIPSGVETLGYYSFSQCNNLTNVNISDSVTNIVERAFLGCSKLSSIVVDNNNKNYSSDAKGVLFNKDKSELIQYPIGLEAKHYDIPEGVEQINELAFYESRNICSITIPSSVTFIGETAFQYCENLKFISVNENNINYFGDSDGVLLSKDKSKLVLYPAGKNQHSYDVPETVIQFNTYAFFQCMNIYNITLPKSISAIPPFIFCDNLKHIGYKGTEKRWNDLVAEYGYKDFCEFFHYNFNSEEDIKITSENPTCKNEGFKSVDCSCGYNYSMETFSKVECSFTDYKVDNNATCLTDGTKTAYCDYGCGKKSKVTIEDSALGHDIISYKAKEATCTEKGHTEYEACTRCRYSTYKSIPAKNHIDTNGDENCDVCELYLPSLDCLCVCHAKTIGAFIYKLFTFIDNTFGTRLLEKVFDISDYCACGLKH